MLRLDRVPPEMETSPLTKPVVSSLHSKFTGMGATFV